MPDGTPVQKKKILILDDQGSELTLASRQLEAAMDVEVVTKRAWDDRAFNCKADLGVLIQHVQPDLILTDYNMGRRNHRDVSGETYDVHMTGVNTTLEAVKEYAPGTPVVLQSTDLKAVRKNENAETLAQFSGIFEKRSPERLSHIATILNIPLKPTPAVTRSM